MSFNTYSTLKASIGNWLARSDLTSYLDDFILLGEKRLQREIRIREVEEDLSVTMSGGVAAIPSDFTELKYAYIDGSPTKALEVKDSQWLFRKFPNRASSGKPSYIAIDGSNFVFGQYPDSDYDVKGVYYKEPAILSSSNTTNEWTDNTPDLLLYASLCASAPFLQDTPRITMWNNEYVKAKMAYLIQDKRQARRGLLVSTS